MYDYVEYECSCPVCNNTVDGFQSKDGDCALEVLQPKDVDEFLSRCKGCGCWISFIRKSETEFTMKVFSTKDNKEIILKEHTKDVRIS